MVIIVHKLDRSEMSHANVIETSTEAKPNISFIYCQKLILRDICAKMRSYSRLHTSQL